MEGSTRSSFHSTLDALQGILSWEVTTGDDRLREERHAAEEYPLQRRRLYRLSASERVAPGRPR